MNYQALFSSKDKSKSIKCHLLQFLFGALRVNSETKLKCIQNLKKAFLKMYDTGRVV